LIILENPAQAIIEKIHFNGQGIVLAGGNSTPGGGTQPAIVRPSSLNYKISLVEAVRSFINKEKLGPDQQIEVEIEEPVSKKMQNFAIMDDALFSLNFIPKPPVKEKT